MVRQAASSPTAKKAKRAVQQARKNAPAMLQRAKEIAGNVADSVTQAVATTAGVVAGTIEQLRGETPPAEPRNDQAEGGEKEPTQGA